MSTRSFAFGFLLAVSCSVVSAQEQSVLTNPATKSPRLLRPDGWHSADGSSHAATKGNTSRNSTSRTGVILASANENVNSAADTLERKSITRVTKGAGTLPNDLGQIWREYDISPYTSRVSSTKKPEQAIVDWILRETGYEAWHSQVVSVLSADRNKIRVYHTPEMHRLVSEVIDRFVGSQAQSQAFTIRVVTVGNPNWRANFQRMLRPIPVQSQGVQAWLVAKEEAAIIMAELKKRADFRQYAAPHLIIHNGQSTVIGTTRERSYVKSVVAQPNVPQGLKWDIGKIDEGYSLEFSPLVSLDERTVDAVIKCKITQIERMVPITIRVPGVTQLRQRIEVPQLTNCDLHEKFRWPTDKVLIISRGVIATPSKQAASPLSFTLPGGNTNASRADSLLFITCKGRQTSFGKSSQAEVSRRIRQRYRSRN